jgi:hypothetical protein
MSAEEFDKPIRKRAPIPEGLERVIAQMAKTTVEKGLDPGKVISEFIRMMQAWNALSQEQRDAIRAELLRRRNSPSVVKRKPRRRDAT